MDLSVIIVNYNVKYFLEQCLHSVIKAIDRINCEVFVVDNNSVDGSIQMLSEKFPDVKLIANKNNVGFAKANNQALKIASGKYVLLLNPDTVVQEDTFYNCINFMNSHIDVGSLGVKMIDGKGKFLPESKRSFPDPVTAFYKIFGLSRIFPRSRIFGRYHLGYLSNDEIHTVDVISGAFMFLRKSALEKTGFLDEDFFMYGEDIDISYRLNLAGYKNVYFPKTTIIHYKGESTKKNSINYVLFFYRAMVIFARKHFQKRSLSSFLFFINAAIYFRAGISVFYRFLKNTITFLFDIIFIYGGFAFLLPLWERNYFGLKEYYPPVFIQILVPSYIAIWLLLIYLTTAYEKKVKFLELVRGIFTGTLIILVIYALLPENWRFSRAIIIIGTFWVLISTILIRYLLSKLYDKEFSFEIIKKRKRIVLIGDKEECLRVISIIKQSKILYELIGFVSTDETLIMPGYLGNINQLEEIVRINKVNELIFCAINVPSHKIIKSMLLFNDRGIEFKIAPPESLSVIGSNSNETPGELYVLHFNLLSQIQNRRKKRLFDFTFSLLIIGLFPFFYFFVRTKRGLLRNVFRVLFGLNSWVGYYKSVGGDQPGLPKIRVGILTPNDLYNYYNPDPNITEQMNLSYAKDYRIFNDLKIVLSNLKFLNRNPLLNS